MTSPAWRILRNEFIENNFATRASPGKNCEAAHPAGRKRRLLDTYQWQSTWLVVGLPVSNWHSLTGSKWARLTV